MDPRNELLSQCIVQLHIAVRNVNKKTDEVRKEVQLHYTKRFPRPHQALHCTQKHQIVRAG